jgi:hypothetical protein
VDKNQSAASYAIAALIGVAENDKGTVIAARYNSLSFSATPIKAAIA